MAKYFIVCALLLSGAVRALATGNEGEHINDLSGHLQVYREEVEWLIDKMGDMVARYTTEGAEAAAPDQVVDFWESVDFHAAIETNYIPLYAQIWQGLIGVQMSIKEERGSDAARAELAALEVTLWQALGAVKMAAQYQEMNGLPSRAEAGAGSPATALLAVNEGLDIALVKYAESDAKAAIKTIQATYLERFEGVEGALISLDAELVEVLELDFNVTLPQAIEKGEPLKRVGDIVAEMKAKVARAKSLLDNVESNRSDVF